VPFCDLGSVGIMFYLFENFEDCLLFGDFDDSSFGLTFFVIFSNSPCSLSSYKILTLWSFVETGPSVF
jgi:hypothetical protein